MEFRGTTICAVKRNGVTAIAGDGQVTLGESVIFKNSAVKVRRIYGGKPFFRRPHADICRTSSAHLGTGFRQRFPYF